MQELPRDAGVDISIVLPCFNEEACVEALTDEIVGVLTKLGRPFEILYVNDASTDGTLAVLQKIQAREPRVRVLEHSVNSGESAGMATGFHHARGAVVVTMDSDQQNDPADIPRFLEALADGVHCVAGVRKKKRAQGDTWVRRVSSKIGNGWRNALTGVHVSDAGCTYRAIRREAIVDVPVFNGMHRFLPTLLTYQGWRFVEIDVNHRPRTTGYSKYGIGNRLWRGIADCFAMRWWRKRAVRGARVRPETRGA
jgi:glycosyltransferase involved in cell wall biosynthesis